MRGCRIQQELGLDWRNASNAQPRKERLNVHVVHAVVTHSCVSESHVLPTRAVGVGAPPCSHGQAALFSFLTRHNFLNPYTILLVAS